MMQPDWDRRVTPGVKLAENNQHGFVGVYYDQKKHVFRAELWHKGQRHRSSRCASAEEAAKHYDELVREMRGPGYPVNFPVGDERGFLKGIDLERFCARGHSREENTYYRPGSSKGHCKQCQKLASARRYARNKRRRGDAAARGEG